MPTNGNANRVICALGGTENTGNPEIHINDITSGDIEIYLYYDIMPGSNNGYYWYNISKVNSGATLSSADARNITYTGNLAESGYSTQSTGMDNNAFISGTGTNSITTSTKSFTSADAFGGTLPKRIIGAFLNRLDFNEGDDLDFYVAIKIKNNIDRYIEKPRLFIASDITINKTWEFS